MEAGVWSGTPQPQKEQLCTQGFNGVDGKVNCIASKRNAK